MRPLLLPSWAGEVVLPFSASPEAFTDTRQGGLACLLLGRGESSHISLVEHEDSLVVVEALPHICVVSVTLGKRDGIH